ncbi:MAG: FAD-dependent oxidoreductase [Mariprofundaceae bacterium]
MPRVAVIGGGVCGLTCAIRLAEGAASVAVYEASPEAGGRAGSFFDARLDAWVDHGPHLVVGAYLRLRKLLADCDAGDRLRWQPALRLPLWDTARGRFALATSPRLPFAPALALALWRLPQHGMPSALAAFRLGLALRRRTAQASCAAEWLRRVGMPSAMFRDMLDPLCLGAMNAPLEHADAASFRRVLAESFHDHETARLGWFDGPLREALIAPLLARAQALGVRVHTGRIVRRSALQARRIDGEDYDRIVLALPAPQRDRLLGQQSRAMTAAIHNQHFWFETPLPLSDAGVPFIGGIGTTGQWFFDVSAQMRTPPTHGLQHVCIVISDAREPTPEGVLLRELGEVCGLSSPPKPVYSRRIWQKRATVLVQATPDPEHPDWLVDAGEAPKPGDLPATIESAVRRGETAARRVLGDAVAA